MSAARAAPALLVALLALPPPAGAQHNCEPVANVPNVAGIWRCDEDGDGWYERTEARTTFVTGGTVVAFGLGPYFVYVTSPPTGAFVGASRTQVGKFTYDCALVEAPGGARLSVCDIHYHWEDEGRRHLCQTVRVNDFPPVKIDCPPDA